MERTLPASLSRNRKELYLRNLSKEQKNFRRLRAGNRGTLSSGRRTPSSASLWFISSGSRRVTSACRFSWWNGESSAPRAERFSLRSNGNFSWEQKGTIADYHRVSNRNFSACQCIAADLARNAVPSRFWRGRPSGIYAPTVEIRLCRKAEERVSKKA